MKMIAKSFLGIAWLIYWGYVIWYLFNGEVIYDMVFVATGILMFFTPIPYLILIAYVLVMIGHMIDILL